MGVVGRDSDTYLVYVSSCPMKTSDGGEDERRRQKDTGDCKVMAS